MDKITKDFFGDEVLLIGYSSGEKTFSRMVYKELVGNGIRVYPVNTVSDGPFDIPVYKRLEDLTEVPDTACVLLGKGNVLGAVRDLEKIGVRRILVQTKAFVDRDLEEFCENKGIVLTVGCPFMAIGKGLHRFHGFLAGVR